MARDICAQEMANGRALLLPRCVKRPGAELIESFKVIGIDNAPEVNKSYEFVRQDGGEYVAKSGDRTNEDG